MFNSKEEISNQMHQSSFLQKKKKEYMLRKYEERRKAPRSSCGERIYARAGGTERRRWCLATEPERLEKDWRIESLTEMNSNALSPPKKLIRISHGSDPPMPYANI